MDRRDALHFFGSLAVGFLVFIALAFYSNARYTGQVSTSPSSFVLCGNGFMEAREECDDGNRISGDGCTAGCTIEFAGEDDSPTAACGNGVLEQSETCDDGNTVGNDGCSGDCMPESDGDIGSTVGGGGGTEPPPCAAFGERCSPGPSAADPRCCEGLTCYTGGTTPVCLDYCKKKGEGPCTGGTPNAAACCDDLECNEDTKKCEPFDGCGGEGEACLVDDRCCKDQGLSCRVLSDGRQICTDDKCPSVESPPFPLSKAGKMDGYEKITSDLVNLCKKQPSSRTAGLCANGPNPNCKDGKFLHCSVSGTVSCFPLPGGGKDVVCTLMCVCSRECKPG